MSPAPGAQQPVTRADIEAKLAEIRGVADDTTDVAEGAAKTGLVVAGVGGRRRGVPARTPARPQEEHHRRGPARLMEMQRRRGRRPGRRSGIDRVDGDAAEACDGAA